MRMTFIVTAIASVVFGLSTPASADESAKLPGVWKMTSWTRHAAEGLPALIQKHIAALRLLLFGFVVLWDARREETRQSIAQRG